MNLRIHGFVSYSQEPLLDRFCLFEQSVKFVSKEGFDSLISLVGLFKASASRMQSFTSSNNASISEVSISVGFGLTESEIGDILEIWAVTSISMRVTPDSLS